MEGEVKNTALLDKLQRRQDERLVEAEKSKLAAQQSKVNSQEAIGNFWTKFTDVKTDIENGLRRSELIQEDRLKLLAHFDEISQRLQSLRQSLADSSYILPSYDVRTAQDAVNRLQESFLVQHDAYLHKKKFAFKARNKKDKLSQPSDKYRDTSPEDSTNNVASSLLHNESTCHFSDLVKETLIMQRDRVDGEDVALQRLQECTVKIYGTPNTVHMSNLINCSVLLGPTSTSVFLENCHGCTFAVACQQLRVHSSSKCDVYVHVESRIIIEDCTQIRFAPYNLKYESIAQDMIRIGMNHEVIRWNVVDDFNWLALDVVSPNWTEIPVNERIDLCGN